MPVPKHCLLGRLCSRGLIDHQKRYRPSGSNKKVHINLEWMWMNSMSMYNMSIYNLTCSPIVYPKITCGFCLQKNPLNISFKFCCELFSWWQIYFSTIIIWYCCNKMENKKYHTVRTVLKIPYCQNSSKNTILSDQQNTTLSAQF